MNSYRVNSIPLKEVIESLATSFQVGFSENCEEYALKLPEKLGSGQIRGINFDNGLGLVIYLCEFKEATQIEFTVNEIHPVKYIYTRKGPVTHLFANDPEEHTIGRHQCAIVASESHNGHILRFEKNTKIEIASLEIDRQKFNARSACEIEDLPPQLQNLFRDVKAEKSFYHNGFYDLEFKNMLSNIGRYEGQQLIRQFFLESITLRIFVNQLILFEDDLLNDGSRSLLRVNELSRAEDLTGYILDNLHEDLSIPKLSKKSGLNPIKLQSAFKYLYRNTVVNYITEKRLERAATLINTTQLNVSEIAYKVGYTSLSYFSKIFKEKYGLSPSEYRKVRS